MQLRATLLSALTLLSACDGEPVGRDNAREYFATHRAELEHLREQVEMCKPWDGRLDRSAHFDCYTEQGSARAVTDAMIAADAQWIRVSYDEGDGDARRVSRIYVTVRSNGLAFAGTIEAFVYESEPALELRHQHDRAGLADVQLVPVTDAPHHWYWQQITR